MKKKKLKKNRKVVREKDWEARHEDAFSHDKAKHRRAMTKLSEHARDESPLPKEFEPNGIVVSHTKKWAFVKKGDEELLCIVDERLENPQATLLAPGDEVLVEYEEGKPIVRGITPRRTRLGRPSPHANEKEQVVAANADVLVVVAAAAQPPFRAGLVDRYLIAAQVGGVEPVLCINKMDLVDDPPAEAQDYESLGMRVVFTSCERGEGIEELRSILRGKLSVLSGHSGVGKSSLLGMLDPNLHVVTQTISESTNRGRHTTTNAQLYEMSEGIRIIDTPGIRVLGLWGVGPEELALYFPEIAEATIACKFRDCTHTHEPTCGVQAAVESGELPRARYESYLRIRASLESETGTTPGRMTAKYQGQK